MPWIATKQENNFNLKSNFLFITHLNINWRKTQKPYTNPTHSTNLISILVFLSSYKSRDQDKKTRQDSKIILSGCLFWLIWSAKQEMLPLGFFFLSLINIRKLKLFFLYLGYYYYHCCCFWLHYQNHEII